MTRLSDFTDDLISFAISMRGGGCKNGAPQLSRVKNATWCVLQVKEYEMPRKNAFALMQTGVIAVPRAEAPCELTGEQADEWRAIVNTMPAEHFMRGNAPLLTQLCRQTARRIAQLVELEAER